MILATQDFWPKKAQYYYKRTRYNLEQHAEAENIAQISDLPRHHDNALQTAIDLSNSLNMLYRVCYEESFDPLDPQELIEVIDALSLTHISSPGSRLVRWSLTASDTLLGRSLTNSSTTLDQLHKQSSLVATGLPDKDLITPNLFPHIYPVKLFAEEVNTITNPSSLLRFL